MRKFTLAALLAASAAVSVPAGGTDLNVCVWGTITGPDALVNGMAYGTRDYFEFLNQTKGGIAGHTVGTLLLDGRYKLDEELKIYRRCVDQENAAFVSGWSTGSVNALKDQINEDGVPLALSTCWAKGATRHAGRAERAEGYARAATPVTSAQTWKASARAARYWLAGRQ